MIFLFYSCIDFFALLRCSFGFIVVFFSCQYNSFRSSCITTFFLFALLPLFFSHCCFAFLTFLDYSSGVATLLFWRCYGAPFTLLQLFSLFFVRYYSSCIIAFVFFALLLHSSYIITSILLTLLPLFFLCCHFFLLTLLLSLFLCYYLILLTLLPLFFSHYCLVLLALLPLFFFHYCFFFLCYCIFVFAMLSPSSYIVASTLIMFFIFSHIIPRVIVDFQVPICTTFDVIIVVWYFPSFPWHVQVKVQTPSS